jgi:hypothetical protein
MKASLVPALLSLMVACGPKKAPEVPAAAAVAAPVVAPVAAAEPEPEPEPEPVPVEVINADLSMKVTRADGSVVDGHVKRIERSDDWYGEEGWTTDKAKLNFSGEGTSEYRKITWAEVKVVTIKPGGVPADVDCVYDGDFTPWLYDCTLKIPTRVSTKDGKSYTVDSRQKWRFVFDDGAEVEFWMKKHPAREQDTNRVDLDTLNPENYDLYSKLQQRLRTERTGSMVVKVEVR